DVGRYLAPVPLDFFLDVDFVDGKLLGDRKRVAGFGVEEPDVEIERVGEAVGRVDAHDEGPVPQFRKLEPSSGRQTRLPYAALAAEEQDAHNLIVADEGNPSRFRRTRARRAELQFDVSSPRRCRACAL